VTAGPGPVEESHMWRRWSDCVCVECVLPERRGVEVKERVHHGWGMGEATKGSEGLRN
jgi:hypothetical protein